MARTAIASQVAENIKAASWIREMFEKGLKLKAQLGDENVHDFSLGNPNAIPPADIFDAIEQIAAERDEVKHRYMPNAGFEETRTAVAGFLTETYGLEFSADGMILTCGTAGATNIAMHAILDPGDEVLVMAPFFPEYRFYIEQAQGKMVLVPTKADFQLDLEAIKAAITDRTRAIMVNTPNNPTGVIYPEADLKALGELLKQYDRDDRPLYLVCDDVYHRVLFDDDTCPAPAAYYHRPIVVSSYSKDISIPGERLGYIAVPKGVPERQPLVAAMTMLNRTLGFVNAPALIQRAVAKCPDAMCDIDLYKGNRDLLCNALLDYGYELAMPRGAMFAFPKTPIADDPTFVDVLLKHHILAVPGRGFGRESHMRLALSVDRKVVERALPGFKAAIDEVK